MIEINSREELINALAEAAELEHGLLCQYVFAASTLKQHVEEGVTWPQTELIRGWKRALLTVARQEMAHLGTVCNLLTAVGGAPHFMRLNFPQSASYFPADAPFTLRPFSEATLRRFMRFEEPEPQAIRAFAIAPGPISYQHVGELYRSIEHAFGSLDERTLFIGPVADQDDNEWSRGLHLWPVRDRASAHKAIEFIIREGEGIPQHRQGSHYQTFVDAHAALVAELASDPSFAPARPVAVDPVTRQHRDAPLGGTVIGDPRTREVAEWFSVSYETTLMMLGQFYSFGPETPAQREELRQAAREMMSGVVRPLAEVLTQLPMGGDHPGLNAGPGFELYGDVHVSPHPENAWYVILERLAVESEQGLTLAMEPDAHPRIQLCAENLGRIGDNLTRAIEGGFPTGPSPGLARKASLVRPATDGRLQRPTRTATARYGTAARTENGS